MVFALVERLCVGYCVLLPIGKQRQKPGSLSKRLGNIVARGQSRVFFFNYQCFLAHDMCSRVTPLAVVGHRSRRDLANSAASRLTSQFEETR